MADFPKWKYSKTKDAVVVENAEQEKALGAGWFDNPEFKGPVAAPVTPKPAAPAKPATPAVPVVEPKKEA